MRPHVPDASLRREDVPDATAPWAEVVAFAHTFHAYKVAGSVQRVATLTVEAHDRWVAEDVLPQELSRLRLCLFHTARATHGGAPDVETERWARALLGAIADQLAPGVQQAHG